MKFVVYREISHKHLIFLSIINFMSNQLFDISHDIKLLNFDSGLGFLIKIPYKNKGLNFLKKLEA